MCVCGGGGAKGAKRLLECKKASVIQDHYTGLNGWCAVLNGMTAGQICPHALKGPPGVKGTTGVEKDKSQATASDRGHSDLIDALSICLNYLTNGMVAMRKKTLMLSDVIHCSLFPYWTDVIRSLGDVRNDGALVFYYSCMY